MSRFIASFALQQLEDMTALQRDFGVRRRRGPGPAAADQTGKVRRLPSVLRRLGIRPAGG